MAISAISVNETHRRAYWCLLKTTQAIVAHEGQSHRLISLRVAQMAAAELIRKIKEVPQPATAPKLALKSLTSFNREQFVAILQEYNISYSEAARYLSVNARTVHQWATGLRSPHGQRLLSVVRWLSEIQRPGYRPDPPAEGMMWCAHCRTWRAPDDFPFKPGNTTERAQTCKPCCSNARYAQD